MKMLARKLKKLVLTGMMLATALFVSAGAFAGHVIGDSMAAPVRPSFAEGDIAVFSDSPLRSRDFALVRKSPSSEGQGEVTFRQVFFDPGGKVRLQPLNLNYTAEACPKTDVLGMWKLAAHLASF